MVIHLIRYWNDLPLRRKGLVVVAIPLLALVIGALSLIVVAWQQHSANDWVEHSLLVRDTTGRVLSYQTDAAASVRGYLLTGNSDYLPTAANDEQESASALIRLESLVRDNPEQSARAKNIGDLLQQNSSELAVLKMAAPGTPGTLPSVDPGRITDYQTSLTALRAEVDALLAREDQLLTQRTSRANQISSFGSLLTLLNLVIGLAGGLFAIVLFTRGIARRVEHLEKQTSRLKTGEPLLPVATGTDELGQLEHSLVATAELIQRHQDALQVANEQLQQELIERGRADETIAQLNRRNELILNAAGDGLVGTDGAGRTIFVNPAAARLLGYRSADLLGEACPLEGPVMAALDGVIRHVADEEFTRRDGTRFPVEYVSTPIRERGVIVGAVVTFKDITERLAVERMKTEFVSTVSHELRTPLTSIRGSLGLLAGGVFGSLPTEVDRLLHIAVSNTDRLIRLINDILDIERLESGRVELSRTLCDVSDLIDQTLEGLRGVVEETGVTISASATNARLVADPDRIIQTLTNLLGNAIKFSPPDSTIWLRVARVNDDLLFSVRDQGRGIPRDKVVSIFDRFSQVDASDSREKDGTGLGLAICRSIVQQHGGHIWAESDGEGQGSTFFFTVPAFDADPYRDAGDAPDSSAMATTGPRSAAGIARGSAH